MSDEPVDIHDLLQAGCYPTARSRSQDPDFRDEPEPLERAPRFYSGTNGKVETVNVGDTRGRAPRRPTTPPPPPTVEDAEDDDPEFADEKPQFRGDANQYPLIIDNEDYANNTEQRFVLVSHPAEKTPESDGPRPEEPTDRGPQAEKAPDAAPSTPPRRPAAPAIDAEALGAGAAAAAAAAAASGPRRRPSMRRRRSPAGLPRIETDMFGPRGEDSKHGRSQSSAPTYDTNYRYNTPRSPDRPSRPARDSHLSPEVIKSSRNREESSYYGASRGPRMSRHSERPSSSSNRRREEPYYNAGYTETPETGTRTRLVPELRSARGSRRTSPRPRDEDVFVPDAGLEDRSAFYPDLSRGAASPPRRRDPRVRRYTNQYSGDESETSSVRRSGRRPIVIQTDGRSTNTLTGDDIRYADLRLRPRSGTVSSKQNGYRDNGPRGPRSPTTAQPFDSSASVTPPYPVEDMMPSQDRPGYLEPDHWGPGTGPRGPPPTATMPIRIPAPSGPRESRPGSRGQGMSHSWQPSPPKPRGPSWQDKFAAATRYLPPGPKQPHISVRSYYEDPRRLELPAVPSCPRKEPVAGKTDWRTLPDDDLFTICPTCYKNVFDGSEYRDHFRPLPPQDPDMKFFCDFGSSPWYVVAWLMSMKHGVRDLRLFQEVARIATDFAKTQNECPGASRDHRQWHSVRDPVTNRALPGFNVCRECVRILGALMPNLRPVLSTPGVNGSSACSLHCGVDRGPFILYVDALERASDEADRLGTIITEDKMVEDIAAVSRPMVCPRDGPLFSAKWYYMPWLPDLTVCEACYEDAACPLLGESGQAAEWFGMCVGEFKVGTCQLYSERMRRVFAEACRVGDKRMLAEAVADRRDKEEEVKDKREKWGKVGDALALEEIERLKVFWKMWE